VVGIAWHRFAGENSLSVICNASELVRARSGHVRYSLCSPGGDLFAQRCASAHATGSMAASQTTLDHLESHLWEAANILRGPVDAADFKTYVFPLLFFKRSSDVYDEEYAAALAESGGDEEYALFPQNYRFQIPEGCHWNDVRVVTSNVGQALQRAMPSPCTDSRAASATRTSRHREHQHLLGLRGSYPGDVSNRNGSPR